jgi:hypothetical protein
MTRLLTENLNANVYENKGLKITYLELEEQWSYVRRKKTTKWLWLVLIAIHGKYYPRILVNRDKESTESISRKLPDD